MPDTRDIMEYDEAHYFGNAENDTITLGGVITEMKESSNPTESKKQYIHQKSSTTKVTGFGNEFPITMDMVKGDTVFEDFYNIFYRRLTGTSAQRYHYIVNLWEPVEGSANTYNARKILQTVSIEEATGGAGEQKQISGSLKGGDFIYGTFNTSTLTFTPENGTSL